MALKIVGLDTISEDVYKAFKVVGTVKDGDTVELPLAVHDGDFIVAQAHSLRIVSADAGASEAVSANLDVQIDRDSNSNYTSSSSDPVLADGSNVPMEDGNTRGGTTGDFAEEVPPGEPFKPVVTFASDDPDYEFTVELFVAFAILPLGAR